MSVTTYSELALELNLRDSLPLVVGPGSLVDKDGWIYEVVMVDTDRRRLWLRLNSKSDVVQ